MGPSPSNPTTEVVRSTELANDGPSRNTRSRGREALPETQLQETQFQEPQSAPTQSLADSLLEERNEELEKEMREMRRRDRDHEKRIAELEAENKGLREQVRELSRTSPTPSTASHVTFSPRLSDKLPDVELFDDGKPEEYMVWERKIRRKMEANEDRYETDRRKILYASSRLTGVASQFVEPFLDGEDAIQTLDEFLTKLNERFGDPFIKSRARRDFSRLFQGKMEFRVFLGEFHRLARLAGIGEEDQRYALQEKVNRE